MTTKIQGCSKVPDPLSKKARSGNKTTSPIAVLHCNDYYSKQTEQEVSVKNRLQLDRRRLEAAHLKYAILQVNTRFQLLEANIAIESDISSTLKEFTPIYYKSFAQRYAGTTWPFLLVTKHFNL